MEKRVQKRLTTQTQVCMEIEEVEKIIAKHFRIGDSADIEWRVSQNCVHGVTITSTEEAEVD